MLEPAQFLYTVAKNITDLTILDGYCRLCGGRLFEHQDDKPQLYKNVIGKSWKQESLTKRKSSSYICPGCSYMFGNIGPKVKPENADPGKPMVGLLKADRRGPLNEKGKPVVIAGIIASKSRGFEVFNKDRWVEFGEGLIDPPEPPFVVLATRDYKRGIQYGPWQSIIAMSKKTYPVFFNYTTRTKAGNTLNGTLIWISPATFKKAIGLAERCIERKIKLPDTPDWGLAHECALSKKRREENDKS